MGWIGVDLDGTLAQYDKFRGAHHIGAPIPRMVKRVKKWLADGKDVRIFTARVGADTPYERKRARLFINEWCREHIGQVLPVTNRKDLEMEELYDDRCFQVEKNTGRIVGEEEEPAPESDFDGISLTEHEAERIIGVERW